MAHKRFFKQAFAFLALALVIALTFSACSNPAGPEQAAEPLSEKYTAVKGSKTYELTVTQSAANAQAKSVARAAFTPAEGDSYVLKITENGATQTSSGTVKAFSGNKFTLAPSINVTVSFEVTINNIGITNISGTITIQSGATIPGPGEITPTGNPGGNTSVPPGNTSVPPGNTSVPGNSSVPLPAPYFDDNLTHGTNTITLRWSAVPGAETYYLQSGSSFSDFSPGIVTRETTYTIGNLQPNTTYYFRVCSMRYTVSADDNAQYSYVSATTLPSPPTVAPTDLTATEVSSSRIRLSWTALPGGWSDDEKGCDIVHYNLYRSIDPLGPYYKICSGTSFTFWIDIDHVTANTTYWYKVSAFYNCMRVVKSHHGYNFFCYYNVGYYDDTPQSSPVSVTTLP